MSVTVQTDGPVAWVEVNNPPVNAASHAVREGLAEAITRIEDAPALRLAILVCVGRTFIAGADIREFGKPPLVPHLPDIVLALEDTDTPWIAAIHGTALGGGLEIAMGCSYRIASTEAKLGLPEVNLGIIPGAGGTVRLPRLVGAEKALDMMAGGKPISGAEAMETGLVDAVTDGDLRQTAREFALERLDHRKPPPVRTRDIQSSEALATQMDRIKAKARGQQSPVAVCDAVQNALRMSAADALAAERALFSKLKTDPQAEALRHIFFAERGAGKDLLKAANPRPLGQIGVIGAGTMGAGIAAAILLAGLKVILIERDAAALETGRGRVQDLLAGSLKRGVISQEKFDTCLANLTTSTRFAALADADLVIEAVFEDMAVKKEVFATLDQTTKPDAVLATNTSYLDVGEIAQAVRDPSRVIGLHFFSPAHIMKLLELVIPDGAAPDVVATGAALGKLLGKVTVPAGVCDGFIGNRIMSAYRREADYMIEDGALPAQVDEAMRRFGFPMGIFEMQDLAGLDISWAMRKRRAATGDPKVRYVDVADKLCEQGRFGRKTGRGWYLYDGKTAKIDPDVTALIETESARKGITRRPFSPDQIMARILSVMQAEGRTVLAEGIARQPSDIDVVMVNGYGFPRWRGGPMFMAKKE